MPLRKGTSKATFRKNVQEFQTGERFRKTKAKSGTGQAIKQAYAVAWRAKRNSAAKKAAKKRRRGGHK
jgi:hypothetical protein